MNTEKYLIHEEAYNQFKFNCLQEENVVGQTACTVFEGIFDAFDALIEGFPSDDATKLIVEHWNDVAKAANYFELTNTMRLVVDSLIAKYWYFGDMYLYMCRENYINDNGISTGIINEAW